MATNLVTLEEYKRYKGISSEKDDSKLRFILNSVSVLIKTYCGRTFIDYYTASKTEYSNGADYGLQFVDESPIQAISSVNVSTDGGVTKTLLVENTDYFVDYESGCLTTAGGSSFVSSSVAHKSLEVIYTGGYEKTPEDLALAIYDLIDYYRNEEYTQTKTMNSATIEQPELLTTDFPTHVQRILKLYKQDYV